MILLACTTQVILGLGTIFLTVWAWRRRKAMGGKGSLTELMNEGMNDIQQCLQSSPWLYPGLLNMKSIYIGRPCQHVGWFLKALF